MSLSLNKIPILSIRKSWKAKKIPPEARWIKTQTEDLVRLTSVMPGEPGYETARTLEEIASENEATTAEDHPEAH